MNKRYNKSESRKNRPYNKSKRRRPHPPYDSSTRRERSQSASQVLEMERGDAIDFDIKIPEVNWEIPSIPDVEMGNLDNEITLPEVKESTDMEVAPLPTVKQSPPQPKVKQNTLPPKTKQLELSEFEVPQKKPKSRQPKVKSKVPTKQPQSLGQQPRERTAEQMREEYQRRLAEQKAKRQSAQTGPAAIIGPIVMMIVILAFVSSLNPPDFVYLLIMFFFGRQIWQAIQGQK